VACPSVSTSQREAEHAAPPNAPVAGLVDQAVAASGAPPPAYGLGVTAPLPARAGSPALSSEAPSVSSIDASPPPRRCATRAPRREEDGGGRPPRAQQAFHASAGIVKGGESFAENSDPWVASDRGRQHSYPVSRPLAHRLHSSYQAAFEAALMSCRIVGRLRWVGGRHGGCRARRHTARSPGRATSGASALASAHGSRCRAAGSAADACTSSTRSRHPTRAIGEVAAPVAVVAQPFGYGGSGPGWVGLWLMRQSSTAAGSSA